MLYLRTLHIVCSLGRRRVTRRFPRLQTMYNVLKFSKKRWTNVKKYHFRNRNATANFVNLIMTSTVTSHLFSKQTYCLLLYSMLLNYVYQMHILIWNKVVELSYLFKRKSRKIIIFYPRLKKINDLCKQLVYKKARQNVSLIWDLNCLTLRLNHVKFEIKNKLVFCPFFCQKWK